MSIRYSAWFRGEKKKRIPTYLILEITGWGRREQSESKSQNFLLIEM